MTSPNVNLTTAIKSSALEIITAAQETDMVLFNVVERIPDTFAVFLAGWDARRRMYEDVVAFTYPLADVKKVVRAAGCLGPMVALRTGYVRVQGRQLQFSLLLSDAAD